VFFLAVHADAKHDCVGLGIFFQITLEIMGFERSTGCHVLGVEVEYDPLALVIMQAHGFAFRGVQREVRRGIAGLGRFGCGGEDASEKEHGKKDSRNCEDSHGGIKTILNLFPVP